MSISKWNASFKWNQYARVDYRMPKGKKKGFVTGFRLVFFVLRNCGLKWRASFQYSTLYGMRKKNKLKQLGGSYFDCGKTLMFFLTKTPKN